MKLCKDCKHLSSSDGFGTKCTVIREWNVVTGSAKVYRAPTEMRAIDGPCGPEATLFEEKTNSFRWLANLFK